MENLSKGTISLREFVRRCKGLIGRLGVNLITGSDFEVFKFLVDGSAREQPLDPIFSPATSNINQVRGQWLIGKNANGEIVQTQAMRMLDLKGATLHEFFRDELVQIRPHGKVIDPEKTYWRLSEAASRISGEVSYHGGLWIRKDFRGGSLAALITRYLLALSILDLKPDFFIGLQAPFTACKGLSAREGYVHLEQRSIIWQLAKSDEAFEDWLVWMSCEEAAFNLAIPPEVFFDMFEREPLPVPVSA